MRHRSAMVLAAAAGLAAQACGQEVMQVSYTWSEVVAGTLTPVGSPNSVLEPGEGARIGLTMIAMVNSTNAVGQTTTYQPPPGSGTGTIRGIGGFVYSLYGDNSSALTASGSWSNRALSPVLPDGAFLGNIALGGVGVDSFGAFQNPVAGQTAIAPNPIPDVFHAVWSPASYTTRTVQFNCREASQFPSGSFIIQYGTALLDPNDPNSVYPLYTYKYVGANFGPGVNIPIAPAPGSALAWAWAAGMSLRRRRRE